MILPESTNTNPPETCTDCIKMEYDDAGRMLSRTDQRGWVTSYTCDGRGLRLGRTTGGTVETFDYDAVGRMTTAQRGNNASAFYYTGLGDLYRETQLLPGGTVQTVDYGHDQAGNRTSMSYPGGGGLAYTHTDLNQVDTVTLNSQPLIDYDYTGWLPDKRRVTTNHTAGPTVYEVDWNYDSHRRYSAITNTLENGSGRQTIAGYAFPSYDNNGNPVEQIADGLAQFAGDDRAFQVDRLDRLILTNYTGDSQTESVTLDLVGNREGSLARDGSSHSYTGTNRDNEYGQIDGLSVSYDPAGNLSIDEDGRHYDYDEDNRLIEVRAANDTTVLAHYDYDALGRRVQATIGSVTRRYYYAGQQMIEERNASDGRLRYHVPGSQYIDEQVASFTDATGRGEYYLLGRQYNVVGRGNADGSVIEAVDYASSGDFAGGGTTWSPYDLDHDRDVDGADFLRFQPCMTGPWNGPPDLGCEDKDFDHDNDVDQSDFGYLQGCLSGSYGTIAPSCLGADLPASGSLAMHGRQVDILPDGKALLYVRARHYDLKHGRWLQRDPLGFVDGPNLYEAFGGNPMVNLDPEGAGLITLVHGLGYGCSDWQFIKDTLWTFGEIAQDTKDDLCHGVVHALGGSRHPSDRQQRLINLVNAEARYGGQTETSELFGRAVLAGISDSVGGTSGDTAATGSVFVYTTDGEVYRLQASGLERVQAGFTTVGQAAGIFALTFQVTNIGTAAPRPIPTEVQNIRGGSTSARIRLSTPSTPQPPAAIIVVDNAGNAAFVPLNDGLNAAAGKAASAEFSLLRQTARFLKDEGLSTTLRRDMIEAGFQGTVGADTPATLTRFQEIFVGTEQAGKTFAGRLGDVSTRVQTIMEAQAMERTGLFPSFEYWTGRHAVDLVGLDAAGNPVQAVQLVRWNRLWAEEIPRSFRIRRDLGIPVRFVVTEP